MKRIVLLFCVFNLALVQMCWAQSHSNSATILGYTYPNKGAGQKLYLANEYTLTVSKPIDSTTCDSMGHFAFKVAVDPANKGFSIVTKDSIGQFKSRASFILEAGETAKVELLERDTVKFEGNQGASHYRYLNCANAMSKRIMNFLNKKIRLKLRTIKMLSTE